MVPREDNSVKFYIYYNPTSDPCKFCKKHNQWLVLISGAILAILVFGYILANMDKKYPPPPSHTRQPIPITTESTFIECSTIIPAEEHTERTADYEEENKILIGSTEATGPWWKEFPRNPRNTIKLLNINKLRFTFPFIYHRPATPNSLSLPLPFPLFIFSQPLHPVE